MMIDMIVMEYTIFWWHSAKLSYAHCSYNWYPIVLHWAVDVSHAVWLLDHISCSTFHEICAFCFTMEVIPQGISAFMWTFYSYHSGLLQWHRGNHMIAPVPVKQPWRIWIKWSVPIHNKTQQISQHREHAWLLRCTLMIILHWFLKIPATLFCCSVGWLHKLMIMRFRSNPMNEVT